ncbi:MAG: DUF6491 family protein [Pseudomonadota bacterium]
MIAHRTAFAAMLFVISACATATTPEQQAEIDERIAEETFANDVRRGEKVDKVCFTREIDGFGMTTDRAVVINEGRKDYLVETFPGCFDLDWAQALAFDSFSSCLRRGDRILALESPFGTDLNGIPNQACRVKAIYEWNKDAEAESEDAPDEESVEAEPLETASIE